MFNINLKNNKLLTTYYLQMEGQLDAKKKTKRDKYENNNNNLYIGKISRASFSMLFFCFKYCFLRSVLTRYT